MTKPSVVPGQIWREDATGTHYLLTRVYQELFDRVAILRQVEGEQTMRLKVRNDPANPLPGFTQQSGEFPINDIPAAP